jgi:hypothetical protein
VAGAAGTLAAADAAVAAVATTSSAHAACIDKNSVKTHAKRAKIDIDANPPLSFK